MVCGDKLMNKDEIIKHQQERIEALNLKCTGLENALLAQKKANEKLVECKAVPPWFRDKQPS